MIQSFRSVIETVVRSPERLEALPRPSDVRADAAT
jgi:hypothetical protein